jgi:hypothetical protein
MGWEAALTVVAGDGWMPSARRSVGPYLGRLELCRLSSASFRDSSACSSAVTT